MLMKTLTSLNFLFIILSYYSGNAARMSILPRMLKSHASSICGTVVEPQGYSCEEHRVTTKDGFILSLQRIPNPRGRHEKQGGRTPVLLQHGLMSDAMTWLANSPDKSLGFILADNGYDVWLGNVRGTGYSSGHTSLHLLGRDDPNYWNWSWDELASQDLPAFLGYIHRKTGQKLHYIGHSLGTLMALGALSQQQQLVSMVRSAALLSPIAYMGQMPSPLVRAAADLFIAEAVYWLGVKEFAPGGGAASKLLHDICKTIDCTNLESVITGPNCCMNSSNSNLSHQEPTATKNMVHLAQMIRRGTIAMYDYGNSNDNQKHYGQATPPTYDMATIPKDFPLFLSYGGKDLLSDVNDVRTLIGALSDHNLTLHYIQDYAHLDFVYGTNAKQLVYRPLMAFFNLN